MTSDEENYQARNQSGHRCPVSMVASGFTCLEVYDTKVKLYIVCCNFIGIR